MFTASRTPAPLSSTALCAGLGLRYVGVEACASGHDRAHALSGLGHVVRRDDEVSKLKAETEAIRRSGNIAGIGSRVDN